ncbi:histidine kinase dimerization/phosphoacceptor domain-containing protein, partial [Conexibacter stalactiti]
MTERSSPRRVDVLIACALLLLGVSEVLLRGVKSGDTTAALALWSAAAVATLWRRGHPLAFFGWALGVHSAAIVFDLSPLDGATAPLYVPLALFGLGAYARDPRRALPSALGGLLVLMALRTLLDATGALGDRSADVALRELAIFAPAAAGGVLLRDRSEALAAARRRAETAAGGESGALELALSAERTRIARELHAVVTGCVRAVLDEVELARSSLARASGSSRSALRRARTVSQQAMAEMRRMLVLLRSNEAATRPDAADVPGSLRELTDRRAGAIDVRRAHAGAPFADTPLPAVAMRVLVALAELPGCHRLVVERGDGVVRASARVGRETTAAHVEALAERARLAGGRLGRGRLRRTT